jgi:predicted AAA+ superfamily ATPase
MYIERELHQAVRKHIDRKEYTIISGPRQCGKTTLIQVLSEDLKGENKEVDFLSLEDRDILMAVNTHPEELFSFIPRRERKSYLFLDEIQHASDPSNLLKYLYDKYHRQIKVIATGSSAFYMDEKFRDSLAGRKRIFELKTLSFMEFLRFRKLSDLGKDLLAIREQDAYLSLHRHQLMQSMEEYLIYGGYPEVVLEDEPREKVELLREIRDSFLKKDIDESGISDSDKFYMLLSLLADQIGNLVNRSELANTIGVTSKTIDRYLQVLRRCYHIELLKPFHSNHRKELTKMPKIFFKDSGLRNSALSRFHGFQTRQDRGQLVENQVFKRLGSLYETDILRFWRYDDRKEVDFVILHSFQEGMAYEVKLKCPSGKNKSLNSFSERYPKFQTGIISHESSEKCKWILSL